MNMAIEDSITIFDPIVLPYLMFHTSWVPSYFFLQDFLMHLCTFMCTLPKTALIVDTLKYID